MPALSFSQDVDTSRVKQAAFDLNSSKFYPVIEMGIGLGVFPDVMVKENNYAYFLDDAGSDESQTYVGIPVSLKVGAMKQTRYGVFDLNFQTIHIARSFVQGEELRNMAYFRFILESGFAVPVSSSVTINPRVQGRRIGYSNISTKHYLDSVIVGSNVGVYVNSDWYLEFYGGAGVVNKFGYNGGSGLQNVGLSVEDMSLYEYGLMVRYAVTPDVNVVFNVDQELAKVVIKDINEYQRFGLNVYSFREADSKRQYSMVTSIMKIGFEKLF